MCGEGSFSEALGKQSHTHDTAQFHSGCNRAIHCRNSKCKSIIHCHLTNTTHHVLTAKALGDKRRRVVVNIELTNAAPNVELTILVITIANPRTACILRFVPIDIIGSCRTVSKFIWGVALLTNWNRRIWRFWIVRRFQSLRERFGII